MAASQLTHRLDALRAHGALPTAIIDDLATFLEGAPDEALFRMSPLRYAAARGISEQEAIDLFLYATHAGVLEFAWGVLCPGCMGFLTTPGGLRSLEKGRRCNFCGIEIEGTIDDRVEVAFTVAPSVRRIRFHDPESLDLREDGFRLYFSSSLGESRPHGVIREQIIVADRAPPGVTHEARMTLDPGPVVLLAPASHAALWIHTKGGAGPSEASVDLLDGTAIPAQVQAGAGPFTLRLSNRTAQPIGYIVMRLQGATWPTPAPPGQPLTHAIRPFLTGQRLVSTQAFRDLFRAESIPAEGGLELKSVTVLFTDLKGSTALYERVGDLRAYDLVRRHFTVLRSIAVAEGGAIVKTIGDAVMASFADPEAATRAAIRMNREIGALGEGDLLLKIGLHTGPCIAVELNDRLDYFGRTVNIAARVEGVAAAGEIVCTEPVFDAPGVREAITAAGLAVARAAVPLKGITDDVAVVRLSSADALSR